MVVPRRLSENNLFIQTCVARLKKILNVHMYASGISFVSRLALNKNLILGQPPSPSNSYQNPFCFSRHFSDNNNFQIGQLFNGPKTRYGRGKGFSLIELLIVIAVSSILVGVITFTLKTSLDTYYFVQDDVFLQKSLDEMLQAIADGDYDVYGVKDSLEILQATISSITFVPLWIDDSHRVKSPLQKNQEFIFNRPLKFGAGLPIGEVLENKAQWRPVQIVIFLDERRDKKFPVDKAMLNKKVKAGSKVRFIYHPDVENFPDTIMTIKVLDGKVMRYYKGKVDTIPQHTPGNIYLKDAVFQYFDNTNTEILPDVASGAIAPENLLNITAIKITLTLSSTQTKKGSVFINLRNTSSSGAGLIIREGTELRIPNSEDIRAFSLVNIRGVKEGGRIELQAKSDHGETWKARIELGIKDNLEVIKSYSIEYPIGKTVYFERPDLPVSSPLSFLMTGSDGAYDYDIDEGINNIVHLTGKVDLSVIKMDANGAALFIRP